MAWLSGWDKRIKFTIDQTKIDTADLTWFPVTVFLDATNTPEVFTELTTDAEYLKVAFTQADGTTELYAEMELFDVSESKGIFHVSKDGWVIDYDVDTDFYMYFDKDHADNANIGIPVRGSELVVNGTDWTGATGHTPPNSWTCTANTGTYTIASGTLKFDYTHGYAFTYQTITVVIGQTYRLSVDLKNFNCGAGVWAAAGTAQGGTQYGQVIEKGTAGFTTHVFTFTATQTDCYLTFVGDVSGANQYGWVDNFSVKLVTSVSNNVWDNSFKMVQHMADKTTSTIIDSTINANDGTKGSANNPLETAGMVGNGQTFSTDTIITMGTFNDNGFSISLCVKPSNITTGQYVTEGTNDKRSILLGSQEGYFNIFNNGYPTGTAAELQIAATINEWQNIVYGSDGTNILGYKDGEPIVTHAGNLNCSDVFSYYIGSHSTGVTYFAGIIDEVRISNVLRTAGWIKATYNSLFDTLLTYGDEETAPAGWPHKWNGVTIGKLNGAVLTKWNGVA